MFQVVFICPLNLDRLTGTPLRIKAGISSVSKFATVTVVSNDQPTSAWRFTKKTLITLKQANPEVIHCITPVAIIPALVYKLSHPSVKVIYEIHGWAWYELFGKVNFFKRLFFLKLDYLGLWFSNMVITVSNSERIFLQKRVIRKNKVVTVWDPVDFLVDYREPPTRDFIKVGYIGNAERWQGLPHIIEAANLLQHDTGIKFELAGFKFDDEKLFPKLSNINYVGRVERKDVVNFLLDCDVHISSRLQEPVSDLQFPHKLSEYLACGRPVIVSRASDQPIVVERGDCGIILPRVDGQMIAEAIKQFASLPLEEKIQMGKKARLFCKDNLYIDVFAAKLKDVYASLK